MLGCSNLVLLLAQLGILKIPWRKVLDNGIEEIESKRGTRHISVGF